MNYMTIMEASQKWNISPRRIQTLCSTERIPGAERLGHYWVIPKDAQKPTDARVKSGKYIRKNQRATEEPAPQGPKSIQISDTITNTAKSDLQ